MTEEPGKVKVPELKTWSLENLGQVIKVSEELEPKVFPYKVSIPRDSAFFNNAYNGVYKGEGVTVYGSEKGEHPIAKGIVVEHKAILAVNDLGEIMVSKEVFQGDHAKALTEFSKKKIEKYKRLLDKSPLPPGWRRIGSLHSHSFLDVGNSVILSFGKGPKTGSFGVTWSGDDFKSLTEPIKNGYTRNTVLGVITPVQLGFMIATRKTLNVLKGKGEEVDKMLRTTVLGAPPYNNFEKLGIVLYGGNHSHLRKNITLKRLIY